MLKRELEARTMDLITENTQLKDTNFRQAQMLVQTKKDLATTEARLKECEKVLDGAGKTIKTMHNTIVISAIREATGQKVEANANAKA